MNNTSQKVTDTQVISEHSDDRVLLASRDAEERDRLTAAFTKKDFEVKAVENVWKVFEALIDYTFDIFVTDSNLPGTTCGELIKYCRKRHPAMQIIILAHEPSIAEAVEITKLGAFSYLELPVDKKKLLAQARTSWTLFLSEITRIRPRRSKMTLRTLINYLKQKMQHSRKRKVMQRNLKMY